MHVGLVSRLSTTLMVRDWYAGTGSKIISWMFKVLVEIVVEAASPVQVAVSTAGTQWQVVDRDTQTCG